MADDLAQSGWVQAAGGHQDRFGLGGDVGGQVVGAVGEHAGRQPINLTAEHKHQPEIVDKPPSANRGKLIPSKVAASPPMPGPVAAPNKLWADRPSAPGRPR